MPIYEYRCAECGHQEEFLQKSSESPIAVCTSCGKPAFQKLLSAAGFQLKGSGWYATDFKSAGKKPADKTAAPQSESKGEAKSESKTESKTDAKPGAKTESKSAAPVATGS